MDAAPVEVAYREVVVANEQSSGEEAQSGQAHGPSFAATVDVAQHDLDANAGATTQAFNTAASGLQLPDAGSDRAGSAQVAREQPVPQLNMSGPGADEVNRQVHVDRMVADDLAAKARNEHAQQVLDAAREQAANRQALEAEQGLSPDDSLGH